MRYEDVPRYVKSSIDRFSCKKGVIEDTFKLPKWVSGWELKKFWATYYLEMYIISTEQEYNKQKGIINKSNYYFY